MLSVSWFTCISQLSEVSRQSVWLYHSHHQIPHIVQRWLLTWWYYNWMKDGMQAYFVVLCCSHPIRWYKKMLSGCQIKQNKNSHRGWTDGTEHRIKCLQVQQKDKKRRKNCENGKELKQSIASHWTVINKSCVQMAMNLCSKYIYISMAGASLLSPNVVLSCQPSI